MRSAAEQGLNAAQYNLGLLYSEGVGVQKDRVQAYAWFDASIAGGLDLGRDKRDALGKELPKDQLAEARKLSQQYLEKYGSSGDWRHRRSPAEPAAAFPAQTAVLSRVGEG